MTSWLRGKRGGLLAFLAIAVLVLGGLAWLTSAAFELERKEHATRVEAERNGQLRLALWRLDSRIFPLLARESSRPYYHYTPTYSPPWAFQQSSKQLQPAKVFEPSPLLNDPLPDWILLHFQVTPAGVWESPQVLGTADAKQLRDNSLALENATAVRQSMLEDLKRQVQPQELFDRVEQRANQLFLAFGSHFTYQNQGQLAANRGNDANRNIESEGGQGGNPPPQQPAQQSVQKSDNEFQSRAVQRAQIENPQYGNFNKKQPDGRGGKQSAVEEVPVSQGLTAPLWIHHDGKAPLLLAARLVDVGSQRDRQAILLDWAALQKALAEEVRDLFPDAAILPVYEDQPTHPERTMTALPLELDPGPLAEPVVEGYTPVRIGLIAAWAAALLALLAVGLGGWSLIDLSERRIRFVSAVTHELRTPLTTLRLYLDMLTGGMVKEPERQVEYLHTLNTESERLNRLISNVLDFSRLENQRPRLEMAPVAVHELLDQLQTTWTERCKDAGKLLVVEASANVGEASLVTDSRLVQQIIGSLIENACKYSRGAEDAHIWVRAERPAKNVGVVIVVEDCGPGISPRDRRVVFRPFHRGRDADPTAGGVGLGLALAHRWAELLGGDLTLEARPAGKGACFRLRLP